jgi:hypothetical protein
MACEWKGVGPYESKLIKRLLFDSNELDSFWLKKKEVLDMKCRHPKFEALEDEHFYTLVKRCAAQYQLVVLWMKRVKGSKHPQEVRFIIAICPMPLTHSQHISNSQAPNPQPSGGTESSKAKRAIRTQHPVLSTTKSASQRPVPVLPTKPASQRPILPIKSVSHRPALSRKPTSTMKLGLNALEGILVSPSIVTKWIDDKGYTRSHVFVHLFDGMDSSVRNPTVSADKSKVLFDVHLGQDFSTCLPFCPIPFTEILPPAPKSLLLKV